MSVRDTTDFHEIASSLTLLAMIAEPQHPSLRGVPARHNEAISCSFAQRVQSAFNGSELFLTRSSVALCRMLVAGILLWTLGGCSPITVNQERQLGAEFSREIQREGKIVRDYAIVEYVNEIGNRLLRGAGPQPFRYRFNVIADGEINAFAAPAGYIYVNTGTILRARNVSELAGVMAHEIGHVVKRHIAQNYNRAQATSALHQIGVMAAGMAGGQAAASVVNAAGGFAGMAYLNSFGRDAEREADVFAVQVMGKAGYDPRGLVTFFETLKAEGGQSAPSFLSSHPATSERIANTTELIRKASLPHNLQIADAGKLQRIQRRIGDVSPARRRRAWP